MAPMTKLGQMADSVPISLDGDGQSKTDHDKDREVEVDQTSEFVSIPLGEDAHSQLENEASRSVATAETTPATNKNQTGETTTTPANTGPQTSIDPDNNEASNVDGEEKKNPKEEHKKTNQLPLQLRAVEWANVFMRWFLTVIGHAVLLFGYLTFVVVISLRVPMPTWQKALYISLASVLNVLVFGCYWLAIATSPGVVPKSWKVPERYFVRHETGPILGVHESVVETMPTSEIFTRDRQVYGCVYVWVCRCRVCA